MALLPTLVLLLGASPAPAAEYETLVSEYEAAVVEWKGAVRAAKGKERWGLRKAHPAKDFWPRFEDLAASDGRGLVWMATHSGKALPKRKQANARKSELFGRLLAEHLDAEWFGDAVAAIGDERRALGEERYEQLLAGVVKETDRPAVAAQAMYVAGKGLMRARDEVWKKKGLAWLERLESEHPDTDWATQAAELLFIRRNLVVGAVAPDFEGATVDGETFKLSDYRGNVVVVKFFGFW